MFLEHVMLKEHGVTCIETATLGRSIDLTLHGVLDHRAYEWKAAPSRSLRVATALHRTVRNACAPREYDSMFLHPREAGDASQRPTKLHHLQASDPAIVESPQQQRPSGLSRWLQIPDCAQDFSYQCNMKSNSGNRCVRWRAVRV